MEIMIQFEPMAIIVCPNCETHLADVLFCRGKIDGFVKNFYCRKCSDETVDGLIPLN
jgi:uncharacterized protein YbaR (Trm112 family)